MVTLENVRAVASGLPRSTEALVRGRVKFRVGQIVYLAFSRDASIMGFAFPKDWRGVILDAEPGKFLPPDPVDVRYNWLQVRLAAIDQAEMRDLVFDAWAMVVPKRLAATQALRLSAENVENAIVEADTAGDAASPALARQTKGVGHAFQARSPASSAASRSLIVR